MIKNNDKNELNYYNNNFYTENEDNSINNKSKDDKLNYLEKIVINSGGKLNSDFKEADFIIIPDSVMIELNDQLIINYSEKLLSEQFLHEVSSSLQSIPKGNEVNEDNKNEDKCTDTKEKISKLDFSYKPLTVINPFNFKYEFVNIKKTLKELQIEYGNLESYQLLSLFEGEYFYIDPIMTREYKELLFYCISLSGGYFIEKKCSMVDFIISNNKNFPIIKSKIKSVYLVNPLFIIKSISLKTRLNPFDFLPISTLDIFNNNNMNNITSNTNNVNHPTIENTNNNLKHYNKNILSKIFKGVNFFFLKSTYVTETINHMISNYDENSSNNNNAKINNIGENKTNNNEEDSETCLDDIKSQVLAHSGDIISNVDMLIKVDYVIANDGYCEVVANFLSENKKNKHIVVSHRFIEYCIEQRKHVNIKSEKLFHVFPMPNKVPFHDFKKTYIKFRGFSNLEENKYRLIAEMLGSNCTDKHNVTHVIISEEYKSKVKDYKKRLEKYEFKSKIWFLKFEWLIECCFKGLKIDESLFAVE